MRSTLLVNKQRFKSGVVQYLQMLFSILLSTFCIALALVLLRFVDKPFELAFENMNASHLLLVFDNEEQLDKEIINWFLEQEEVEYVGKATSCVVITEPFLYRNKKLDVDIQITERTIKDTSYDKLKIFKGSVKEYPEIGEIWLPYHFENTHGIVIGDTLGIPANGQFYNMRVSAFVVDPHYLSPIFNPTRAWVAPGALSFFLQSSQLNQKMIGVRMLEKESLPKIQKRFIKEFDYSGISLEYTLFKATYSTFSKLLGLVLLFFGLIVLFIALLIIRTTIKSNIFSEFKQIGILRSLGYTKKGIIISYQLQSIVLALIAIPIGLFFAKLTLDLILGSTLQKIGITQVDVSLFTIFFSSGCIIGALILIVTYLSSRKATKVRPIDAFRNIKSKSQDIRSAAKLKLKSRLPLPFLLSIRFIRNSLSSSISLLFGLLATFIILLLAINITVSFNKLKENKIAWGFDQSDLIVNRQTSVILPLKHKALLELLKKYGQAEIKTVVPYENISANLIRPDKQKKQVFGKIYADSIHKAGVNNLIGSHPFSEDEISLCFGTANDFEKIIGDSILIEIEGFKRTFKITGIYQDISSFGQGFRLHQNSILRFNPLFEPQLYGLVLHDAIQSNVFKKRLLTEFGETITVEESIESRKSIQKIISSITQGILVISLLFVLIALVLISNDIIIETRRNDLIYAQLKSLGFSSSQLRFIILNRTLLIFLIAILLGIPIGLVTINYLTNTLASGIGVKEFPLVISWSSIAGTYVILLFVLLLTSWSSSKLLKKINPRKLIGT